MNVDFQVAMCLDAGSTPAVSIYVWLRLIDTVKNVDKSTFFYFVLKKFEFFAFYLTIKISLILSHLVFLRQKSFL